ncbi:hypothetical protein ACWA1F_07300 [Flavobacterium sp. 3-218]
MKKNSLIVLLIINFISYSQVNKIKIKYSIQNEKHFLYREKIIEDDTLVGYGLPDKIYLKNKFNLNYYFFGDKLFLNDKIIYCFSNVQYYEKLLLISFNTKEYLYIYPHYYGHVGPYIWHDLGVLIEIKPFPIIKENMNYFEDSELFSLLKSKKYEIRNLSSKTCTDGS